jgi:hypothetical protein
MSKKPEKVADLPEAEYKRVWPQEKNFKYLKKMKDPRFGDITLLKNAQTGEVIFCKEKMASSKKEATSDIM